jgi:hypothetical protein
MIIFLSNILFSGELLLREFYDIDQVSQRIRILAVGIKKREKLSIFHHTRRQSMSFWAWLATMHCLLKLRMEILS